MVGINYRTGRLAGPFPRPVLALVLSQGLLEDGLLAELLSVFAVGLGALL